VSADTGVVGGRQWTQVLSGGLCVIACAGCLFVSAEVAAQVTKGAAGESVTQVGIVYHTGDDQTDYQRAQCRLDLYRPLGKTDFPTVVWFHGGGLQRGHREIPKRLQENGIAIVGAGYRFHPQVKSPTYVEDAAAAVAWTVKNIEKFGGSADQVFVGGHSAGGYLALMVGLDKRWLAAHQLDANRLAGIIPYSGHAITHFTVRAERGIGDKQPVVDDMAPLFHVRKDAPPLLLMTGDRKLEMLGRYEETAYLWRMMQVVGHSAVELVEWEGFGHSQMVEPAHLRLLQFVRKHAQETTARR
jgi:acetyl esterase/lipase